MKQLTNTQQSILLAESIKDYPQQECPVVHDFSDGVYARTILMPKGSLVVGLTHKTKHLNIIIQGKAEVICGEDRMTIEAPHIFESGEGVKKTLYILEDMLWTTIHKTDLTDPEVIVKELTYNPEQEYLQLVKQIGE